MKAMKYVICVPDGCADEPVAELDGKTPLQAAKMPVLSSLAERGTLGRAKVIPEGFPPGSDVGNMSIFGYDPAKYHTGRAPIEAAALGIKFGEDQVAFRCNLVEVGGGDASVADIMLDFSGGHPSSDEGVKVIDALNSHFGHSHPVSFYPGLQYRHIMVAPRDWAEAACVPPHDLTNKPVVLPSGPHAQDLCDLIEASREVLADFEMAANQIWLWGQGKQPQMPSFKERWGLDAGLVTAVDLVRGIGVLTDIEVIEVEGATGWYDTNYEGKRDAVLEMLADSKDLAVLHVEASDEAGHAGDIQEKVKALENWDARIFAGLIDGLDKLGDWRMLVLPDHATPLRLRTHTSAPVPYLMVDSQTDGPGGKYSEAGVADAPVVDGHKLLSQLVAN